MVQVKGQGAREIGPQLVAPTGQIPHVRQGLCRPEAAQPLLDLLGPHGPVPSPQFSLVLELLGEFRVVEAYLQRSPPV